MKTALIAALFVCGTAVAAQHFVDGSVLLDKREAEYVINVVNNLTEKVVLQDLKIRELEADLKKAKNAKCL